MSFHSDLIADGVWPADIRTATGLTGTAVYVGRRPKAVPHKDAEVMIERGPTQERSRGGFEKLRVHTYTLRVRVKSNAGGDHAGKAQQDTVEAHLRTLSERYHGQRVLTGTLTNLVAVSAGELSVDVDSARKDLSEGTLRVSFVVEE